MPVKGVEMLEKCTGSGFILVATLAAVTNVAKADSFFLENGSLSAGGQQISVTRLPITLDDGSTVYRDAVIRLKHVNGKLVFEAGYPKLTPSVFPTPGQFVSGSYKLLGTSNIYTLAGPYDGANGRSRWILTQQSSGNSSEFHTGLVSGHPLQARILKANITAKYTFGYALANFGGLDVYQGNLVALSGGQNGNIYLYDYSTGTNIDKSLPIVMYTFVKQ